MAIRKNGRASVNGFPLHMWTSPCNKALGHTGACSVVDLYLFVYVFLFVHNITYIAGYKAKPHKRRNEFKNTFPITGTKYLRWYSLSDSIERSNIHLVVHEYLKKTLYGTIYVSLLEVLGTHPLHIIIVKNRTTTIPHLILQDTLLYIQWASLWWFPFPVNNSFQQPNHHSP